MSAESKIRELLMQWESLKRHGRQVSVEELCRDCPEFIPALEQNIAALETIDRLLASRQDEPRGTLQPGEESSAVGTASTGDTEDLKAPAPSAGEAGGSSFRFELKPEAEPVPGYRLVSLLGRGGFGEVWKATAPGGFPIAMKFVARLGQREKVETRALNILKSIRHPNLLATFGAWQVGGWLIIAMELGDQTLHDRYQQARAQGLAGVPRDELLEYLHEAAKGIDYLNEPRAGDGGQHAPGAQHRDIKPQNILLVGRGVKVADFGLARLLEHTLTTHTGSLTPGYAAPEFIRGKTSNRSDQYSLAVTYCELRGGRLPFAGSVEQVLLGHLEGSPDLSMLPEEERPAVARALAKDPAERWPSCRAFVEALIGKVRQGPTAVLPGGPVVVTLRHRSRVMSSVILAAAFVLIVTTVARRGGPPAPDVAWKKQQPAIELEPLAAEAAFEGSRKAPRAEESMPTVSPAAVRESTEAQPVEQRQWRLAAGGENVDSELAEREKASTIRAVAAPGGSAPVAPATEASESGAASVRATAAPPAGGSAAGSAAESGTEVRPEMPLGELLCFRGHSGDVRSVAASPDGRHVLSAGEDRCMRLWEMELGLELHCFTEPTAAVHSVAFSPNGRRALSGSADMTVRLWDLARRQELHCFRGHTDIVQCVTFSGDGRRAVSAGRDGTVRVWGLPK